MFKLFKMLSKSNMNIWPFIVGGCVGIICGRLSTIWNLSGEKADMFSIFGAVASLSLTMFLTWLKPSKNTHKGNR